MTRNRVSARDCSVCAALYLALLLSLWSCQKTTPTTQHAPPLPSQADHSPKRVVATTSQRSVEAPVAASSVSTSADPTEAEANPVAVSSQSAPSEPSNTVPLPSVEAAAQREEGGAGSGEVERAEDGPAKSPDVPGKPPSRTGTQSVVTVDHLGQAVSLLVRAPAGWERSDLYREKVWEPADSDHRSRLTVQLTCGGSCDLMALPGNLERIAESFRVRVEQPHGQAAEPGREAASGALTVVEKEESDEQPWLVLRVSFSSSTEAGPKPDMFHALRLIRLPGEPYLAMIQGQIPVAASETGRQQLWDAMKNVILLGRKAIAAESRPALELNSGTLDLAAIPVEAYTVLSSADGRPTSVQLDRPIRLNNIPISPGFPLAFHPHVTPPPIKQFQMPSDHAFRVVGVGSEGDLVPCLRRQPVTLQRNGGLEQCVLSAEFSAARLKFARYSTLQLQSTGQVAMGHLVGNQDIGGVPCAGGAAVTLHRNVLTGCTLARTQRISGVPCRGGEALQLYQKSTDDSGLRLRKCTLDASLRKGKQTFRAGTLVQLRRTGQLQYVQLRESHVIGGIERAPGMIRFDSEGAVQAVRVTP